MTEKKETVESMEKMIFRKQPQPVSGTPGPQGPQNLPTKDILLMPRQGEPGPGLLLERDHPVQ